MTASQKLVELLTNPTSATGEMVAAGHSVLPTTSTTPTVKLKKDLGPFWCEWCFQWGDHFSDSCKHQRSHKAPGL